MSVKTILSGCMRAIGVVFCCLGATVLAFGVDPSSTKCDEAGALIRQLGSPTAKRRESSKRSVLTLAGQSRSSRTCVVGLLKDIVDEVAAAPEGDFVFAAIHPQRYRRWVEATDLLGTLKASEALDSLINALDFNDGKTSLGIGFFPAARATVKFGDEAVPKLELALQKQRPQIRVLAVRTLWAIGGDSSKQALKRALEREQDPSIREEIRRSFSVPGQAALEIIKWQVCEESLIAGSYQQTDPDQR